MFWGFPFICVCMSVRTYVHVCVRVHAWAELFSNLLARQGFIKIW